MDNDASYPLDALPRSSCSRRQAAGDVMLTFDEPTHTYFWNGKRVPGVSEIMRRLHEPSGFDGGYWSEDAAARGRLVHELTARIDAGTFTVNQWDEASISVANYLGA